MYWLIDPATKERYDADKTTAPSISAEYAAQIDAEHVTRLTALLSDNPFGPDDHDEHFLSLDGSTAVIAIDGVLSSKVDYYARLFGHGNTTYAEITAAISAAEHSDHVTDIRLEISSPGGEVDGLFDTLAALQSATKPLNAVACGLCASAAYALAAQTSTISATNAGTRVGSIGVAVTMHTDPAAVLFRSTSAPNKNPDVTTTQGRAAVQDEIDALHELFVESIAVGRNTTTQRVNDHYGQGGTLTARAALDAGMIDKLGITATSTTATSTSNASNESAPYQANKAPQPAASANRKARGKKMDIDTLKAEHPAVYAAVVKVGIGHERDRVKAHLIMGKANNAFSTAHEYIESGGDIDQLAHAKYMTESVNVAATTARIDDNVDPGETPVANPSNLTEDQIQEQRLFDINKLAAQLNTVEIGA